MIWSQNLAYTVGLITSDGSLSKDKRHIDFTSKDLEQIINFKSILQLTNKIGRKYRGEDRKKYYYRIQFGNVVFYKFLLSIGLIPNKSKTLKSVRVPNKYFPDFLRGNFDGDGYSYSYWDKRWKSSFMLYIGFTSASMIYLEWLSGKIFELYGLEGTIKANGRSAYQLVFAKRNSIILADKMYNSSAVYLKRKRFKIEKALGIIDGL